MPERAYERHAWIIFAVLFILFAVVGLGDLALGVEADPAHIESVTGKSLSELRASDPGVITLVDQVSRIIGAYVLGFSLLGIAVSATGFRRGERWAWYALWSLPLTSGLIFAIVFTAQLPGQPLPAPLLSAPVAMIIAVIALLLPYRKFFPKS